MLAALFTLIQLKAAQCQTACGYLGYDRGLYSENEKGCLCIDVKDFNEITTRKRIVFPKRKKVKPPMEPWREEY